MKIAGTGHRPDKLGGYNQETKDRLYKLAHRCLKYLKPEIAISGMALGWDIAIARASLDLDIPLTAAIPFLGQEKAWPTESQIEYNEILSRATEIVVCSEGGYAAYKMQVRNKWMVDNCDLLLALWNKSAGGTANCVKYADSVGRDVLNVFTLF
jgi:uncharacterized phage-like protein YoqJ